MLLAHLIALNSISEPPVRRMLKKDQAGDDESPSGLTRRNFVALSLAAGLGAVAASASGKELPVVETDVSVTTADGICDAVFIHPVKGSHPGVLVWQPPPPLR